jgi:hypothetical protein
VPSISTTNDGVKVKIFWDAPDTNFAPLKSYTLQVLTNNGLTFADANSFCDEDAATILSARLCTMTLVELRAFPFSLTFNKFVIARVKSENQFGESDYSQTNIMGATIRTEPQQIKGLEYLPLESNDITISLKWLPLVTQFEVGGETIITYNIQWDEGTDGVSWKDVQGQESIPSLTTSAQVVTNHLILGNTYKFRLQALNIHGWSFNLATLTVLHSFITIKPDAPTITMQNLYVKIAWNEPSDLRAAPVTAY